MEEINKLKVFTVEEANRLIPRMTELLQDLQRQREAILTQEVEIDALELVAEKKDQGSPSILDGKVEQYNHAVARFYALIDEIQEWGCFLKDLDLGLVDFYSIYQSRVVYLCWKLGEKEVGHWHEVGRGYTYRQPIDSHHDQRESSG